MEKEYSVVELFAGCGGLALGLHNAGLNTTHLIEVNKDCCETLRKNKPEWNVICEDVSEFNFKEISADVVVGGFPCQAFSYAGKKRGFEDARGTLFFEFARAIKEIQPKIFIGENVAGLITHEKGNTLKSMIQVLEELGYDVKYKLLNSVNFSVPQKRKRVIIIGTQKGINFNYPKEHDKIIDLQFEWFSLAKGNIYQNLKSE